MNFKRMLPFTFVGRMLYQSGPASVRSRCVHGTVQAVLTVVGSNSSSFFKVLTERRRSPELPASLPKTVLTVPVPLLVPGWTLLFSLSGQKYQG